MKSKNKAILVLSLFIIALSSAVIFYNTRNHEVEVVEATPTPVSTPTPTAEVVELPTQWSKEEWQEKYQINNDYVADIRFESGLIDLPVVQGETNDTYLRTDWQTMKYDIGGSIFMDSYTVYEDRDDYPEDHNIVIYGHYFYHYLDPEQEKMFTPLHQLIDEENYETNKYVDLLFEDEIRRYEVADVFYTALVQDENGEFVYTVDEAQYYLPDFDSAYLQAYQNYIQQQRFYETGVEWNENDYILTLQTCVENRDDLRLIVIAKEVGRYEITE